MFAFLTSCLKRRPRRTSAEMISILLLSVNTFTLIMKEIKIVAFFKLVISIFATIGVWASEIKLRSGRECSDT